MGGVSKQAEGLRGQDPPWTQTARAFPNNASKQEARPVLNSEVFLLGNAARSQATPPSPLTPRLSPPESLLGEELLDDNILGSPITSTPVFAETYGNSSRKDERLRNGLHVLDTEMRAMMGLKQHYELDFVARHGFDQAVELLCRQGGTRRKLLITGVGKSGLVGRKIVATFQSLGIKAVFLHPTEALHGDLGLVDTDDTVLFITHSGKTQELLALLPHLHDTQPIIVLTGHTRAETCEILRRRPRGILLPAVIPQSEKDSFGVPAPTTSTTVTLAVGDALAIAAAREMHDSVASVFARNHPGGAIGAAARTPRTLGELCDPWEQIEAAEGLTPQSIGVDLLRAGCATNNGWIRMGDTVALQSKVRTLSTSYMYRALSDIPSMFFGLQDMVPLPSTLSIRDAARMIEEGVQSTPRAGLASIIAVMDKDGIHGIIQAQKVLDYA